MVLFSEMAFNLQKCKKKSIMKITNHAQDNCQQLRGSFCTVMKGYPTPVEFPNTITQLLCCVLSRKLNANPMLLQDKELGRFMLQR